jgi:hypothetical protein
MYRGLCKDKRIYSILSDPIEMVPSGVAVVPVCPREIITQTVAQSSILQIISAIQVSEDRINMKT